jgi:hypothetical protein
MSELQSRKDIWTARAKAWGTVLAAIGGLVTALSAFFKPRDDSATKAAYVELARGQEGLSADVQSLHADVAALRGYIAAKEGAPPPISLTQPSWELLTDAGAPPKVPLALPRPLITSPARPKSTATIVSTIQLTKGGEGVFGAGVSAYAPAPAASLDFPPPTIHDPPTLVHPAPFDQVLKTVK